jgi:hypothetical protein
MEKEIDQFIESFQGYIFIYVNDFLKPSESELESFLQSIETKYFNYVRYIHLTGSGHGTWMEKFQVFGTPALLIFHQGKLCLRLLGQLRVDTLKQLLWERVFTDHRFNFEP